MKRCKMERLTGDHGQEYLPAAAPGLHSQGSAVEFAVGGEIECQAAGARKAGKGPEPVDGTEGGCARRGWRQAAAPGANLTPEAELVAAGWVCGHAADREK